VLVVELPEPQILAGVVAVATQLPQDLVAQVLSSFVIQIHLRPQQVQQVHQQSLWLEALGSINSQPLVLLRSSHVGLD
jgi:hypothetical protein